MYSRESVCVSERKCVHGRACVFVRKCVYGSVRLRERELRESVRMCVDVSHQSRD